MVSTSNLTRSPPPSSRRACRGRMGENQDSDAGDIDDRPGRSSDGNPRPPFQLGDQRAGLQPAWRCWRGMMGRADPRTPLSGIGRRAVRIRRRAARRTTIHGDSGPLLSALARAGHRLISREHWRNSSYSNRQAGPAPAAGHDDAAGPGTTGFSVDPGY